MKNTPVQPLLFVGVLASVLLAAGLIIIPTQKLPLFQFSKSAVASLPTQRDTTTILTSDFAFFVGRPDARVTVTEFLDFQCPYCRAFAPTLRKLMLAYNPSDVKFVFRHFPIVDTHPYALAAAQAAVCAKEQNKFLELHDLFYQDQDKITPDSFFDFADRAGLQREAFERCVAEERYQQFIVKDMSDGRALGIQGTPTTFVNEERIEGAQSEATVRRVIDKHLMQRAK